jgi:hypothetical protein
MSNINFVNLHRYQDIERVVYQKVKEWHPKIIVELGHGSGALTSAMGLALQQTNPAARIYSYDINGIDDYALGTSSHSALKNITSRGLENIVKFTKGDVFDTWVSDPCEFDLLLIDIDNTWDMIYRIIIENAVIHNCMRLGAKVLIEGGDPNHPRINNVTLAQFNKTKNNEVFKMNYLTGSGRTSLSILEI